MARAYPLTDLVKLVRAYGVLAGTSDMDRVIAGTLSRDWIAKEVEHLVPLSTLPRQLFNTLRGRDLLAAELFPNQDIDPETLDPEMLDISSVGRRKLINTNRLPKLEPVIHAAVLAANMLLGVRLYGCHGKGMKSVTHDLIVASMLQECFGKPYRYSTFSSDDNELVDESYLNSWFGPDVTALVISLSDYIRQFEAAVIKKEPVPDAASPELATAVAAIMASRLRLTARAAGDKVISFLDKQQRLQLAAVGVDCSADFPELPFPGKRLSTCQCSIFAA